MSKSPKAIADLFSANARFLQIRPQLPSGTYEMSIAKRETGLVDRYNSISRNDRGDENRS